MNESLFVEFSAWFKSIAKSIEERVNGKKTELTYLYKEMLTEQLSVDLKWNTLTVNSNIVAADVVALSSTLPLKKRDSFGTAGGEIPKLGMKMQLTEKEMTDLDVLKSRNVETKVLVDKIFGDQIKCTMGIHEKMEYMYLQGLSTGFTLIDDDTNVGTGIRVNYGYSDDNRFGATTPWSDIANAKPIDDIKRIVKNAKTKGDTPAILMMDDATFDNFASNQQTRENYAFSQNFVGAQIPTPDLEQVNAMMQKRFKLTIIIVDRTVTTERDGVRTENKPWADGIVVFLRTAKVGKIVYGILAEETRKSPKCIYEKSGSFILLKKWSTEEPFAEFTSSQALVLPVIDNTSSIYLLDTEEAETGVQTEGNTTINIFEDTAMLRSNLITALTEIGIKNVDDDLTDAQLIAIVNKLSDKKEAELRVVLPFFMPSRSVDNDVTFLDNSLISLSVGDKVGSSISSSFASSSSFFPLFLSFSFLANASAFLNLSSSFWMDSKETTSFKSDKAKSIASSSASSAIFFDSLSAIPSNLTCESVTLGYFALNLAITLLFSTAIICKCLDN